MHTNKTKKRRTLPLLLMIIATFSMLALISCSPFPGQQNPNALTGLIQEIWRVFKQVNDSWIGFVLQAIALFGLPILLCGAAHHLEKDTRFIRILCAVFGFLLAASFPLRDFVIQSPLAKGWALLIGTIVLAFLPYFLAFLLVRERGPQKKLAWLFYVSLAILAATNFVQNFQ